jgi:tetratricopeptide (TPR) repeat protein
MLRPMPWCVICRAEYAGSDGAACPRCGTGASAGDAPAAAAPAATPSPAPETNDESRPAHLAVLDSTRPVLNKIDSERIAKKRLVSSAGPSVPVRKQANDSVPTSWMSRLEAARTTAQPGQNAPPPPQPAPPSVPPPLKPHANGSGSAKKADDPVGKPAHLLIAQLEAEEEKRSKADAARAAALFADDKSDEIARVEIALNEDSIKKKRIPDWVVILVIAVVVLGAIAAVAFRVRKEAGPKATIDPVVAAQAERKKQAVAALDLGHNLVNEQKPDEAIQSYAKALELDPMMASAERGLAIAYAAKNDDEKAIEHYRAYLKLAPNASDAEDVRGILDKYEKKKKEAADAAERAKAEEKRPKNGRRRNR